MFELVIVWSTGDKEIYTYETEQAAETAAENFRIAFGSQVCWTGVRHKL